MTTPRQPSSSAGTSSTHRHTGPADTSVTGWLVEHTAVIQTAAYFCAGGFVVGLLRPVPPQSPGSFWPRR